MSPPGNSLGYTATVILTAPVILSSFRILKPCWYSSGFSNTQSLHLLFPLPEMFISPTVDLVDLYYPSGKLRYFFLSEVLLHSLNSIGFTLFFLAHGTLFFSLSFYQNL